MPRRKKSATPAATPAKTSPTKSQPQPAQAKSSQSARTPTPTPTQPPKDPLASLFSQYASPESAEDEQVIAEDKLEALFKDMSVDPDGRLAMIFAWQCGCQELGMISKDEFKNGLKKMGYSYQGGLTAIAQELKKKETALARDTTLKNAEWKELYTYGFNICKETAEKRGIDKALASAMLKLLLGERQAHVPEFCTYLEQDESVKVISLDVWNCFCDFAHSIQANLSNYNEDDSWPCLIDQYVAFRKGETTEENSQNEILVK